MTIAEVLSDEALRGREFPVTRHKIFLAHAGVCPLPRRVADAIREYAAQAAEGDQEEVDLAQRVGEARQRAARLLGAAEAEIAFVGPTSLALSCVASGFPFRKGDNVLIYHDDYPSNVYPWMALAEKGVEVRCIPAPDLGRIRRADVESQVDEHTRLVALASCHFVSGWRIDLPGIGQWLRSRRIAFCVDAIQTAGAFPTPVAHVDFLAADSHKWLLGPCAAGILFVRREWQPLLRPPIHGWHNLHCPDFIAQDNLTPAPGARRYEAGSDNLLGLAGLHAALGLILELGVDAICRELLRKRAWLVDALRTRGWTVLHADAPPEHASGIVSIHHPTTDIAAAHARLARAGIVTSLRADRTGRRYLRLSPHFYNTDDELARTVETLSRVLP